MAKYYDLTDVFLMSGGDNKFVKDLVSLFTDSFAEVKRSLTDALNQSNAQEIGNILHKIKPTAQLFRLHVAKDVKQLESAFKAGILDANLSQKLTALLLELEKCVEELIDFVNGLN